MGEKTAISWADSSWNPVRGCTRVSAGCANCYMFELESRYGRNPHVITRSKTTFSDPLKWRTGRRVFVCSLSDLFHIDVDPYRDEIWDIMRRAPQHTYKVLTKRPERMGDCLPDDWGTGWPNVQLGVTVERRDYLHRVDVLLETPAATRFISVEPMLGPVTFGPYIELIDQVICGAESGHKRRPFLMEWARALRDECVTHGVAFFFKQQGASYPGYQPWLVELDNTRWQWHQEPGWLTPPVRVNDAGEAVNGDWGNWPKQLSLFGE